MIALGYAPWGSKDLVRSRDRVDYESSRLKTSGGQVPAALLWWSDVWPARLWRLILPSSPLTGAGVHLRMQVYTY